MEPPEILNLTMVRQRGKSSDLLDLIQGEPSKEMEDFLLETPNKQLKKKKVAKAKRLPEFVGKKKETRSKDSNQTVRKGTSEYAMQIIDRVLDEVEECADCDDEIVHWASVIHPEGKIALICDRCSGVHRSLGTMVVSVRSLRLDFWDDKLAERLDLQNIANFNEELEYYVPHGNLKPTDDSLDDIACPYIINKYKERKYSRQNNANKKPKEPEYDYFGGRGLTLREEKSVGVASYNGILNIFLTNGEKLPTADLFSQSDPYVIVRNGKFQSAKSKHIDDNNNPLWNENLSISVNENDIVKFEVYDKDMYNDDLLGIIEWDWVTDCIPDVPITLRLPVDCSVFKKKRSKQAYINFMATYTKLQ